jgi:hypothetical protein
MSTVRGFDMLKGNMWDIMGWDRGWWTDVDKFGKVWKNMGSGR